MLCVGLGGGGQSADYGQKETGDSLTALFNDNEIINKDLSVQK